MRAFVSACVLSICAMIPGCARAPALNTPVPLKSGAAGSDRHALNRLATVGVVWKMKDAADQETEALTTGVAINGRAVLTSAPFGSTGQELVGVTVVVVDVGVPLRALKAKLLSKNEKLDLLVIGTAEDLPASVMIRPEMPELGADAYTLDLQMTHGRSVVADMRHRAAVSFVDGPQSELQGLIIDVGSVTAQSVGCGLFGPEGEMIGLVTRPLLEQQSVSTRAIVLPARYLAAFVRSSDVSAAIAVPSGVR